MFAYGATVMLTPYFREARGWEAREAIHWEAEQHVPYDINDVALVTSLLREESLDTIVHFAAETHVDRSIMGPAAFITTNVVGTQVVGPVVGQELTRKGVWWV